MKYLIKCEGWPRLTLCPVGGQYLATYDAATGESSWTSDAARAMHFDNLEAAIVKWREPHALQPIRPDGRPNRPLTAFSVSFPTYEADQ